jgi:Tol biopolymer transport system component
VGEDADDLKLAKWRTSVTLQRLTLDGERIVRIVVLPGSALPSQVPIVELNDAAANDIQPNVRKDGREIVFSSNRAGGQGGPDIWSATRASVNDPWSDPVNLGPNVNTGFGESRPSLSWDTAQLLFCRAGPLGTGEGGTGASDIYVTSREKEGD